MTDQEIQKTILRGALTAATTYLDWSKDMTIHDSGIESFITIEIGRKLIGSAKKNQSRNYVWFETSFNDVRHECNSVRPGRKRKAFEGNPRADIAYFDPKEKLRGVIEVKRGLRFSEMKHDIRRIADLLKDCGGKKGTLKFGCCVGIREVNARTRKKPREVLDEIEKKAMLIRALSGITAFSCWKKTSLRTPMRYQDESGEHEITGFYAGCLWLSLQRA